MFPVPLDLVARAVGLLVGVGEGGAGEAVVAGAGRAVVDAHKVFVDGLVFVAFDGRSVGSHRPCRQPATFLLFLSLTSILCIVEDSFIGL